MGCYRSYIPIQLHKLSKYTTGMIMMPWTPEKMHSNRSKPS